MKRRASSSKPKTTTARLRARAKGIDAHPVFKLGKAPARPDPRNFKLAALLQAPPPAPPQYDFDLLHPGIPTPMFANDVHGDCVMAARAHMTLRFEDIEQGSILMITDQDVLKEYFKESGGADGGLNLLDSLNEWRQQGWRVGKKKTAYNIHAFAEVTAANHEELKSAIFLLNGACIGLALPNSAKAQLQAGQVWDVTTGPDAAPNSWGGHCVMLPGYNATGPVCVTWGRKQQMTWAFFDKYCDEAFAIVDELDKKKGKPGIDVQKLTEYLNELKNPASATAPATNGGRLTAGAGDPIEHVVVLMLENRSFDHLLGCMQSLYPELEGIDPSHPRSNSDGKTSFPQQPGALFQLPYGLDPKHELPDVAEQMAGSCLGFVGNFVRNYPALAGHADQVMAYFDRQGPNRLPVLHSLAEAFTICDHWYSSVPGPTWPNRFFVHSGTSQGRVIMPSGLFSHWHAYDQDTLYDRLNEQGVSWRIYFGDIAQSLMLAHQRQPANAAKYSPMNHFYADVTKAESDFPQYVFIEPLYFGGYENDQHPPANMMDGELLLAKVYNALRANDALWQKTLLVVLYDEHGGFYDHVLPPPAVPPDAHTEEYTFDQYGLRVPALLISPYAPKGVVSTLFDHTSLLRYLTDKWQLGPLGNRTAQANSFAGALLPAPRTDTPASIPEPNTDAQPLLAASLAAPQAGPPPINDLQQCLMAFTQVLEADIKEPAEAKAKRLRQTVKSPEAHMAAAKQRHDLFLAQQRQRAKRR